MKNCASSSAAVAVVAMGWKPSLFGFDIAKSVCIIFPTSNQLSPPAHPPSSLLPPSSPSYSSLRPSRPRALRREMSLSLSAMSYGPLSARHQWLKSQSVRRKSKEAIEPASQPASRPAAFLRKSLTFRPSVCPFFAVRGVTQRHCNHGPTDRPTDQPTTPPPSPFSPLLCAYFS